MRVNDLYKDKKGIFHYMNLKKPLIFSVLMDIPALDMGFIALHGGREVSVLVRNIVSDPITPVDMENVADVVLGLYGAKWENLFNVMTAELPLETYKMITTESIDDLGGGTSTATRENSDADVNQVTGYNSPDYVNDDKSEKTSLENTTNANTIENARVRNTEIKGNQSNIIDDRIKAIKYLNNNLIYDTIYLDISSLLGSLIY